jgi:exosortase
VRSPERDWSPRLSSTSENLAAPEIERATALPSDARAARVSEIGFGVAIAALLLLAYRALIGFDPASLPSHDLRGVEGMLFEPSGSSPLLVFAATAWLFARRWARFRNALGAPARPLWGALLWMFAFVLAGWAYYVQETALLIPSLTAAILGSALLLGGTAALRAVLLPASFLLFAVPIPPAVLNHFMYDLQIATARSSARILQLFGGDALTQAERIYHDGRVFQVIESCSGVRSVETLFMSSFLYHDLFYRSRLQSMLVVFSSIGIGLFVNQIRVLTIVLNPYSHFAAVHTLQGLVMIAVGVFLLALVDSLFSRFLSAKPWWRRSAQRHELSRSRLVAVTSLARCSPRRRFWCGPWQPVQVAGERELSSLPAQLAGWTTTSLKLDREFLGSVGFSEWVHRRYVRDAEAVEVLLGTNRRLDERIDFRSPKLGILGSGWEVIARGEATLPSGRVVQRLELRAPGEDRQLSYLWTEGIEDPATEVLRSALALDRGPWRRTGRAWVARLTTRLEASPEESDARLRAFAAVLEPELARVLAADRH